MRMKDRKSTNFHISIGPYSYAKDLRNFQKKYLDDASSKSEKPKKKKNKDADSESLRELSSIKKDL